MKHALKKNVKWPLVVCLVLLLSVAIATTAEAGIGSCNADIAIGFDPFPDLPIVVGDVLGVDLILSTGPILGGTGATFTTLEYELDCVDGTLTPTACDDETLKMAYGGDATITTDCGVAWSTNVPGGGAAVNNLIFTAAPLVTLPPSSTCKVNFEVEVLEKSTDTTPETIEALAHSVAACDNGLVSSSQDSVEIPVNECVVALDKYIELEDGTPVGQGIKDGPPAVSVDDQPLTYWLVATNPGDPLDGFLDVGDCRLLDPKLGVDIPISSIVPDQPIPVDVPRFCDAETEGPNEARIVCNECGGRAGIVREDLDTMDLECQTPDVSLVKQCIRVDGNVFDFEITIENTGQTALDCTVEDRAETGPCPQDPTVGPVLSHDFGILGVGSGPAVHTFPANILDVASCNNANATCLVLNPATGAPEADSCISGTCAFMGTPCSVDSDCGLDGLKIVEAQADDTCQPEGEWTRTPGFWCTHPNVINNECSLPIEVCGQSLGTTDAGTQDSTSEALGIAIEGDIELQLARQCTAAALNAACGGAAFVEYDFCCGGASCVKGGEIPMLPSGQSCIDALDLFNNSGDDQDTTFDMSQYNANPRQCQAAKKTKMTIFGERDNNKGPDRDRGPRGPRRGRP